MRLGVIASFLFHLAIVGVAFISLPSNWRPDVAPEPYIPLELIREAELALKTSVPAARPEPVEEDIIEPDLPDEPEVEEEPPAPVEEQVAEALPEPEPEPAPVVTEPEPKEPEVAPEPKPEPPKPPQTAELDLDALSQLIDKEKENERTERPRETPSQTTETADRARAAVGAGDRLTASDKTKMQAAVNRCWNTGVIIGAPEPETLLVVLEIDLNPDGTLRGAPRVANSLQINLSGNRFWKVAEQYAVRAAVSCAPYSFLPPDRYEDWKEFKLNFIPPV